MFSQVQQKSAPTFVLAQCPQETAMKQQVKLSVHAKPVPQRIQQPGNVCVLTRTMQLQLGSANHVQLNATNIPTLVHLLAVPWCVHHVERILLVLSAIPAGLASPVSPFKAKAAATNVLITAVETLLPFAR